MGSISIDSSLVVSQVSLVRQRLDELIGQNRLLYSEELYGVRDCARSAEVLYYGTLEAIRNS